MSTLLAKSSIFLLSVLSNAPNITAPYFVLQLSKHAQLLSFFDSPLSLFQSSCLLFTFMLILQSYALRYSAPSNSNTQDCQNASKSCNSIGLCP